MSEHVPDASIPAVPPLTAVGRYTMLVCAFLGWLCAGFLLSITSVAMQSAAIDLLGRDGSIDVGRYKELLRKTPPGRSATAPASALSAADETLVKQWKGKVGGWFAWFQCSFLFGAATGGLVFGWLGDRLGRSKAMALSILTYSLLAAAAGLAQSPPQLLLLWFLACTGVGGMWPNGVALVSEAWSSLSRPMAAGVIGTSANIGIFFVATLASLIPITPESWRWVLYVAASPVFLGVFSLVAVPESPRWLAARGRQAAAPSGSSSVSRIFRPPYLAITLVGIALATIPLIGGWGSANWMVPWAGEMGERSTPPNPALKAHVQQARAITGIVGSLLGGWVGSWLGRRRSYFLVSLLALGIAQYTFWRVIPTDPSFLWWVAALGFFSGIYFGWMPLFLPELFPTEIRSTGAGVSFNFGRIVTAVTIFATGAVMEYFEGDYARLGRVTSLIFALGMIVIFFAPDTSQKQLEDD